MTLPTIIQLWNPFTEEILFWLVPLKKSVFLLADYTALSTFDNAISQYIELGNFN